MGEKIETLVVFLIILGIVIFLGVNGTYNGEKKTSEDTQSAPKSSFQMVSENVDKYSNNGEYKNNEDNGTYVMLSENANGTFKVIFVESVNNTNLYPVQLDEVSRTGIVLKYANGYMKEDELQIALHEGYIKISENSCLGQEKFVGVYTKVMDLSEASVENFKTF